MATIAPSTALAYASSFIRGGRLTDPTVELRIMDDANKMLWMLHPWSWSLGALGTVTFADGTQDYTVSDPGDFLRIQWAARTNGDYLKPIGPMAALPVLSAHKGPTAKVAVAGISGGNITLRYWPVPNTTDTGLTLYKKTTTKITDGNKATATTLTFPDEFYPLYQEIVLYKAWQFTSDPRAGGAQSNGQQNAYTGQLGLVMALAKDYYDGEPLLVDALGLEVQRP